MTRIDEPVTPQDRLFARVPSFMAICIPSFLTRTTCCGFHILLLFCLTRAAGPGFVDGASSGFDTNIKVLGPGRLLQKRDIGGSPVVGASNRTRTGYSS